MGVCVELVGEKCRVDGGWEGGTDDEHGGLFAGEAKLPAEAGGEQRSSDEADGESP